MTAERSLLLERGWVSFALDPGIAGWMEAVREPALGLAAREDLRRAWLRCGGTWFAGVNALDNAGDGSVASAPPLSGQVVKFLRETLGFGGFAWDPAQVSICYPGYPKRDPEEESSTAHRYRLRRHAAHVDGIGRVGPERRRHLTETHGFVLGLPLTETEASASPLSVWEGSHEMVRTALQEAFADLPAEKWGEVDLTEIYQEVRRHCFEHCRRVSVVARPGESYVVHRLALHGVGPWKASPEAPPRAVVYFRPDPYPGANPSWWLEMP